MTEKLENYMAHGSLIAKKVYRRITAFSRSPLAYNLALFFSVALLLLTTGYAGLHASNVYSTDSNAIIMTQQFSGHVQYPVTLPGPHATILIIPLLYLQGHLPYHYTSFTLVNIGLVLATMIAWAILLIRLFGRRYEIPILILLSSLIFTSVAFSLSIGYTTIRNIEYPIVLWFVSIVGDVIKRLKYTRRQLVWAAIGSAVFAVTLAGDSYYNYVILLPLLAVMAWYWVQSRQFSLNMVKAVGLLAGVVIGAALLKLILSKAGIIHFDYTYWGATVILPAEKLLPSLGVALIQLMQLHGGFIFGEVVNYHDLAVFVNFGLLLAGVVGLVLILIKANRSFMAKKGLADNSNFVITTMAVSFFVGFLIFTLSGYAITTLPNGQIISDQNARYISLLPLISVIGIVWLLKNYYTRHIVFVGLFCLMLVVGIVTSHPGVSVAYASGSQNLELVPPRSTVNSIVTILKDNNVSQALTDYWYGPILRFWTNNTVGIAPRLGCTNFSLVTGSTGNNAFTHQHGVNSALIIDRGGLNYGYWSCTDDQITQLYGTPSKEYQVPGAAPGTVVEIWIYNNGLHS